MGRHLVRLYDDQSSDDLPWQVWAMGYELAFATLAIRRNSEPDWLAADRAIECLQLETIWATADDFFPHEGWLGHDPAPSDPDVPVPLTPLASTDASAGRSAT